MGDFELRFRSLIAGIALCATVTPTSAAVDTPQGCSKIPYDDTRLACYDRFFKVKPESTQETKAPTDWQTSLEKSKMDDSTAVILVTQSEEVIDCGWNRGDRVTLHVRCIENTTAMVFSTGCHMTGHGGYGEVTYRLDDDKPKTARMTESTNNRSLGLWTGARAIPVIKQMFGKSQMIARMTPFSENSFTATFKIGGLEEAIQPLRDACHW
ncbi:type VI secretion system-associated protein TagO [Roseibium aggregatum]|uniref:type VI secretion system-associated protein TagO n=1 Tax=Roseibium aggregatum TaxID=187304 RepID=UPI001E2C0A95|nr:type VI secretion system-associated protein TagO [Roseibium aggregatum]UES40961.1 hypothetical protein GFC08_25770 [Roseibium aggregatum]